jgi:anti-sigma factor RsiW
MHRLVSDRFEEYLDGLLQGSERKQVEAHLASCQECRIEVEEMRSQSAMLHLLRPVEQMDPAPGFYARLIGQIEQERAPVSVWASFLQPAFAKQLVFACLLIVVLVGGYVASGSYQAALSPNEQPEAIIATDNTSAEMGQDKSRDRDQILVTLAGFSGD